MDMVDYRDEFKEGVTSLWGFDKDPLYVQKKRAVWDWQYGENPHAEKMSKGVVLLEDGEVVAFLGIMPVKLKYGDRVVDAHWTLDGIMNPKCRGKGYGEKIYTKGVRACEFVHLGIGMNDITEHLLKKAGCVGSDEVEQHFFSNRSGGLKGVVKRMVQQMGVLGNIHKRPGRGELKVRVVDGTEMPPEIDALWKKVEGEYPKIVVRDFSYMSWKYSRHPLAKYKLILVEEGGELVGLGVFRGSAAKSRLVDYVGPAKDLRIKFLIAETFKRSCSNSDYLECICSDKEIKTALAYLGFRRYGNIERFYVYSTIEGDQNWEKNWFIMGGESDNDIGDHLAEYRVRDS
jgi:hypothetical protein